MDRQEFKEVMLILFKAYRKKVDSSQSDTYYLFFKDYPLIDLKRAVLVLIKSERFFPSVNQILDAMIIDEGTEAEIRADIFNAIRKVGHPGNPEFKYEVSQAIINDIGWLVACDMTPQILNDQIHYKFEVALTQWRECKKTGREFILEDVKGKYGSPKRKGEFVKLEIKEEEE